MRSTADQYRIIAAGAGWIERADRGRLRIEGRDAPGFLQRLLTNDMDALAPGRSVYAAYLTPQGRMICDLTVHRRGDHLIADVPADAAAALAATFDQLIFTEDVRVIDVSSDVAQLSLIGPRAAAMAETLDGACASSGGEAAGLPCVDVLIDTRHRLSVAAQLETAGAVIVSPDCYEAIRIDAGRPKFGVDMHQDTIPLEAGLLDRAISTSKGCYVGQEIIIRVLHRGGGRVARRLVRLRIDGTTVPTAGTALTRGGQQVGRITSAAVSPRSGESVALGYVQREHAEVDTTLDADRYAANIVGFAG